MTTDKKPELRVTVFSDYICPFCYIGDVRLNKLRKDYDLKVNWCFLEIHPDTPAQGMPVTKLDYSEDQLNELIQGFYRMAEEEGLDISKQRFTTNSHSALLLAEAAKEAGSEAFYRLHQRLFEAYFGEGQNIGDRDILRQLADACGVGEETVESAWSDPRYAQRLGRNLATARELSVTGTPTFFFTERAISGAVTSAQLYSAAREGLSAQTAVQH